MCLCSDQPGWATVVSLSTSCLGTNAPSIQFIPQQCYSETSASFAVDKFHGVTIGPNVSVTVTGPAKSPYGFNLLDMAMSSAGTVVFNGPTQLYDMQHGNTLLATVTGALPGTLKVAVTAAGRPSLHKSMSGTVTKRRGEQPVIAPPDLWESSSVSSPSVGSCKGDTPGWTDTAGDSCAQYLKNGWCCPISTPHCNMQYAMNGVDSDVACCDTCSKSTGASGMFLT